jgi:hypothetical protein
MFVSHRTARVVVVSTVAAALVTTACASPTAPKSSGDCHPGVTMGSGSC